MISSKPSHCVTLAKFLITFLCKCVDTGQFICYYLLGFSIFDYRPFFVPYGRRISLYENRIGFLLFGLVI